MTLDAKKVLRLQFLARVVRKECQHLAITDSRLFKSLFTWRKWRSSKLILIWRSG